MTGDAMTHRPDDELDRCLSALTESIRRVRRAALGPDVDAVEQAVADLAHARADLARVRSSRQEDGRTLDPVSRERCDELRLMLMTSLPHVAWSENVHLVTSEPGSPAAGGEH